MQDTTIYFDEAGMVDTQAPRRGSPGWWSAPGRSSIAVGDGKQLPSIGPGGMFDRLTGHAPSAELADIHRTRTLPNSARGRHYAPENSERAMAHYDSRGQLHIADTRDQAVRASRTNMGHAHREAPDIREVALIADASNQEIDRLNARAQHYAHNAANSDTTKSRCPASTTASAKATS